MRRRLVCLPALVAVVLVMVWPAPAAADAAGYQRTGMQVLSTDGGRVDWSPDGSTIYFDRKGTFRWEVWKMAADGSGQVCLTCSLAEITDTGNRGQPAVDPTGRWLAFQAAPPAPYSDPGSGYKANLWVLDLQAAPVTAHKLYDTQAHAFAGTLHPVFSHDGTKLLWTDFEAASPTFMLHRHYPDTRLLVADFLPGSPPTISSPVAYNPGPNPNWMESHGWTPDDRALVFTCTPVVGQNDNGMDICSMDLAAPSEVTRLTTTSGSGGEAREWDEHAHLTPAGDAMTWVSSQPYGVTTLNATATVKTDLWIMDPDGTSQRRITSFNDPASADSLGTRAIAADHAWHPDGTRLALFVLTPDTLPASRIFVITFGDPAAPVVPESPVTILLPAAVLVIAASIAGRGRRRVAR